MNKIKRGYKVVRFDRTFKLYSMLMGELEYRIRKRVFPKKNFGPLCVFTNLNAANFNATRSEEPVRIYECTYLKSDFNAVWTDKDELSEYEVMTACLTTYIDLADWVRLERRVYHL